MIPLRERLLRKRQREVTNEELKQVSASKKRKATLSPAPSEGTATAHDEHSRRNSPVVKQMCALKFCLRTNKLIDPWTDDRMEVRTSLSEVGLKSLGARQVEWSLGGEGVFHAECWQHLLRLSRQRTKKSKKRKQEETLSQTEKLLVRDAAKTCELHHSERVVATAAATVAKLIRSAKHCIAFTGAGISTAAGIGDYRGKSGKWTNEDRAKTSAAITAGLSTKADMYTQADQKDADSESDDGGVPYEDLRPTYTHEALAYLVKNGLVRHVISQNGDGLHGLSGLESPSQLSELHGNVFIEHCESCKTRYSRPFYTPNDAAGQYFEELHAEGSSCAPRPKNARQCRQCGLTHRTGRRCERPRCHGFLQDSIINFGDDLEKSILDMAESHAKEADLCLSLGTTMQVTPACNLVLMGKEPLRLVICNRQQTALDDLCDKKQDDESLGVRVFGDCDLLLQFVMRALFPATEVENWENGRDERLQKYDTQRSPA